MTRLSIVSFTMLLCVLMRNFMTTCNRKLLRRFLAAHGRRCQWFDAERRLG